MSGAGGGGLGGQGPGQSARPQPQPQPQRLLPTIRLVEGQLLRALAETEQAILAAGLDVFSRAGTLLYPVGEAAPATGGGKTVAACLREFTVDALIVPIAESAIFQRYSARRKVWADVDPPQQIARVLLAYERARTFRRISGVITTPTLRADGSLLANPGYDPATELYLWPSVTLPAIPQAPTREDAEGALAALKDLLAEFSFKTPGLDLAVALSALITALLRGPLPAAPIYLVRGDTPGVGKSYLVDVIATIATGRLCPVIAASRSVEETEKRISSVLLDGSPIVSLDNLTHDLDGELLCQVAERPMVKVRILGRNQSPDCECHTMVFATGNNVTYKGDMVRRGLTCELEALSERPELRAFKRNALKRARANRAYYIAAVLTIARAYLTAKSPSVCDAFGSYDEWSTMVRSPLVWLGEPDPIACLDKIREEDSELSSIREFFDLWPDRLLLNVAYTTARIVEIACEQKVGQFEPLELKAFLLQIAAMRGKETEISPDRLGRWLKRVSGRIVAGHRLIKEQDRTGVAKFRLVKMS